MVKIYVPEEQVVIQRIAFDLRQTSKKDMQKKRLHPATRCQAVSENSVWFFRIAPFLLLLLVPGTSCNDAVMCKEGNILCEVLRGISDRPTNVPQSLRNSQVCDGFRCGSSECVEYDQICDSVKNCADGSDENPAACINRTCEAVLDFGDLTQLGSGLVRLDSVVKSWRCDNGECISDVYRCDGHANCGDASDETELACFDRSCTPAQFTCKTGQCIRRSDVCDGTRHCFDGTDESKDTCRDFLRNRRRTICPARVLNYCADRTQCYQKRQHCDGEVNCFDGSDEDPETCGIAEAPDASISTPPTTPAPAVITPPIIPVPAVTTPAPPTPTPFASGEVAPDPPEVVFPGTETRTSTRCDPPSCPCPVPGMEHVCLPCRELDNVTNTCIQLQSGTRSCSVERRHRDIKVDILTCGGQGLQLDFSIFERNSHECVSASMVPVLTVVLADCWSAASLVLRCHSDGTWGEYGVETTAAERMWHICQPRHINSQVCGRKPRYKSTGKSLDLNQFYYLRNLHPWLVGLKRWERYECSATLITSTWLITAAHCVIRNQARINETIDPRNLKVQLTSQRRYDQFVDEIWVHPHYVPGSRPHNDIALIRLERPLPLSGTRYPACVDLNGDGFLTSPFAMTFSRPNGENVYKYKTVLQQVDPACHSPVSRCRSLVIEPSQFCGIDLEEENYLLGGSSGGPFMQTLGSDQTENLAVSGIVSYAVEKKDCGLPFTVYSTVHLYKDWIQDVINSGPLF